MKKLFTGANIQAAILLIIAVAETVIMAVFKPLGAGYIVLLAICSLAGIAVIRFAPYIGLMKNKMHSAFYRRNGSSSCDEDEPSALLVFFIKLSGYILFAVQTALLFL